MTLCTRPPHGRAGGPTTLEVPGGPSPGGSQGQGICSSMGLGKAPYTPQFGGRGGGLESYACPQDPSQSVPGHRKHLRLSNRRAGQSPDGVRDWKASTPTQPSHSLSPGQQPEPTENQPKRGWGRTSQSQGGPRGLWAGFPGSQRPAERPPLLGCHQCMTCWHWFLLVCLFCVCFLGKLKLNNCKGRVMCPLWSDDCHLTKPDQCIWLKQVNCNLE